MRNATLAVTCTAILASSAGASIVSATPGTLVHTPPSATSGSTYGGQFGHAWNERQQIAVTNLAVDFLGNAGHSGVPTPGLLSGVVDSHMLHSEPGWPTGPTSRVGTVTFNAPIVGVIWSGSRLNASDGVCGPAGTAYGTSPARAMSSFPIEYVTFSGNSVSFQFIQNFVGMVDYAQVRVLTAVPAPGSAAALALAGGLASRRRRPLARCVRASIRR